MTETIELRFGSSSGRHGLERTLITREPDGDEHDVVFTVDQIEVTSPTPGVSTALDISDQGEGRNTYTRIRVGSADRTVSTPTATYVLTYRVQGLMRSFAGYDELYWDLTGSSDARDHRSEGQHHRARRGAGRDLLGGHARQPGSVCDLDDRRQRGRAVRRVQHSQG